MFRSSRLWVALVLVAVFSLSAALSGCGGGQTQPATDQKPAGPTTGGKFVWAQIGEANNLNPLYINDNSSDQIAGQIFNGLVTFDTKLQVQNDLATKVDISPDGKTYTVTVRKDVKWHDGQPLKVSDVAFTFHALLHPGYSGPYRSNVDTLAGAGGLIKKLGDLKKQLDDKKIREDEYRKQGEAAWTEWKEKSGAITVKDDTVTFMLDKPFAPFLSSLSMGIVPEHLLKDKPWTMKEDAFNRKPVGTGPYKFQDWVTASHVTLVRNQAYFKAGQPYLETVIFRVIPDTNTAAAALERGEIDGFDAIPPDQFEHFKNNAKNVTILEFPQLSYTYLGFNLKNPLFADQKVRQAISHALDKENMIKELFKGHGVPAWTHGSPVLWSYDENSVVKFPYDVVKSKKLLEEAGWKPGTGGILEKNGQKFKFALMTNKGNKIREQAAVVVQDQLKKVGIQVETQYVDWPAMVKNHLLAKNFEAVIVGWSLDADPDPWSIWHTGESYNFISYSNKALDELMQKGRTTIDQTERKKIYAEFQKVVSDEQPYVFLYFPNSITGYNKKLAGPVSGHPKSSIIWNLEELYLNK